MGNMREGVGPSFRLLAVARVSSEWLQGSESLVFWVGYGVWARWCKAW